MSVDIDNFEEADQNIQDTTLQCAGDGHRGAAARERRGEVAHGRDQRARLQRCPDQPATVTADPTVSLLDVINEPAKTPR